ncbi:MAG: hypothetical protein K2J08_04930 [Ruminococcus sp.]|nr:hypothetical protein [Ruminococcus sp.]
METARPLSEKQKALIKTMTEKISGNDIKAVSFRLEGSLVVTPFSADCDLFMFMEEDFRKISRSRKTFAEIRTEAYKTAEKKCSAVECVTLEKVYAVIGKTAKISEKDTEFLMKRECELIKRFSFPRQCGKSLYTEAVRKNRQIIIIAGSLYPKEVVRGILEKCGYTDYKWLMIPQNTSKGGIFDAVFEKISAPPKSLIHIGSNVEYDVEVPVLKGIQAMLVSPVVPMMVKSGRLRGFAEAENILEIDSPDFLALRCAFGLYALYGFDFPQNKVPKSDFCNDPYMLGFMVLGLLSLDDNFQPQNAIEREVISAMEKNSRISGGRDDFIKMFSECFGEFEDIFSFRGFSLPFAFLVNHSAPSDRLMLGDISKKLAETVTEPDLAPVYSRAVKKNALSKFADKLFPHGTKVRTIADGILAKSHR